MSQSQAALQARFLEANDPQLLEQIEDAEWKAAAALDAHTSDVDLKTRFLDLGLQASLLPPVDANDRLLLIRRGLLEERDLVSTYNAIYASTPPPAEELDGWEEIEEPSAKADSPVLPLELTDFLEVALADLAAHYAASAHFQALRIVYQRHGPLISTREKLHVASCVPAHADPTDWLDFVPASDGSTGVPYEPWRATVDWADAPLTSAVDHLSAEDLTTWYIDRIQRADRDAGTVDAALSMVQHAVSKGVQGLDELGEDLSLLSRMVYERAVVEGTDWTLAKWRTSTPEQIFAAYLEGATPASIVAALRRLALPYAFVIESKLERAGTPDPALHEQLLRHVLFSYAAQSKVHIVAPVVQASKPTLPVSQRLIQTDEELAKVALACLYGCKSLDQWSAMSSVFECLPAFESAENVQTNPLHGLTRSATPQQIYAALQSSSKADLSACLDRLDVHLEQAETFARWNAAVPLIWLVETEADAKAQLNQATKMARVAARGGETELESEDEWEALKEDLCRMTRAQGELPAALGMLEEAQVLQIFFNGLLSAGRFSLAKSLFNPSSGSRPIDPAMQEQLVLDASRELYDNSESGNLHRGSMKLAYECLAVAPPTPRVRKEREFMEATSRLASFRLESEPGVPLSPIQIRLTKDKLTLIARLLSSNDTAYTHPDVVLELVQKLGYRGDKAAEVRVLAMIADSALQAANFAQASEVCTRLVKTADDMKRGKYDATVQAEAEALAWSSCFQIGKQSEYTDAPKRLQLLGHALLLCPPSQIESTLELWRRVEQKAGQQIGASPTAAASPVAPKLHFEHVQAAGDSARNISRSAATYLRSASPLGSRLPSAALDTLLHGREGGVRDTLTNQFASSVNWLIGEDGKPA